MKNLVKVNLNDNVLVKLKDEGYQYLADDHNRLLGEIPGWVERTPEYFKNKADENGHTRFQLHEFMRLFGNTMGIGFEPKLDINIIIEVES